ncbi:hypothetical protein Q5H92_21710 [Hymenobacter sp. M29]|uniref:Uncharacterized protein n=1 Tax=Hymenobacter mellowenesis TaxID=3063995 RepID=A0ABT9AGK4_9BACT|nr:hypothetical protein [Hymenobacter sp. M29]MDO7848996.1 hypothetical protein [Hymenobacter sp. M29]
MKRALRISAAAALGKIADIIQFKLNEDYDFLAQQLEVQELNDQARAAIGIDLLHGKENLSLPQIRMYEDFLEKAVKSSLVRVYDDKFIADQIAVLDKTSVLSLEDFKAFSYTDNVLSVAVKVMFKAVVYASPFGKPVVSRG